MLIRMVLITLLYLCYRSTCSNSCPHERLSTNGKKIIGSRKDKNTCMTFLEVDWSGWWKPSCYEWLNLVPCREFKNGGSVTAFSPEEFKLGDDWQKDVTLDYLLLGFHTFNFKITTSKKPVFWDDLYLSWDIIYFTHDHRAMLRNDGFWTTNYWPGTDALNDVSKAPEYVRYLKLQSLDNWRTTLDGKGRGYATCPTVYVKNGVITRNNIHPCLYLSQNHLTTHHRCVHDAYSDCEMKIVSECHYVESAHKSYDRYMTVDKAGDPPYGKPCKNWTYEEIGAKICESNCTGTWGQWKGEPKIICGKYNLYRFRPPRGSTPCYAQSHDCCMEMKTIATNVPCEDFAYNSTINLQIEKCLNGGKLGRDKMGHLMCECNSTFKGIRCETNMCTIECKNGGTCSVFKEQAFCLCQPSFSGSLCEDSITLCDNMNKCHNGGTCVTVLNEKRAYCKCAPGFAGPSCLQSSTFCTMHSCNLRGACYNLSEHLSFKCKCHDGFSGERCELTIKEEEEEEEFFGSKYIDSTGVASAVLLLLALIALCTSGSAVTYRHHRRRRRRRRLQSNSECPSMSSTTRKDPRSKLARVRKSFSSKNVMQSLSSAFTKKKGKSTTNAPPNSRRVGYVTSKYFTK